MTAVIRVSHSTRTKRARERRLTFVSNKGASNDPNKRCFLPLYGDLRSSVGSETWLFLYTRACAEEKRSALQLKLYATPLVDRMRSNAVLRYN